MDIQNLVRLTGDVITELDVVRADWRLNDATRRGFDDFRDRLDTAQRVLVRNAFRIGTAQISTASLQINALNDRLRDELKALAELARAAETTKQIVDIIERLAGLRF